NWPRDGTPRLIEPGPDPLPQPVTRVVHDSGAELLAAATAKELPGRPIKESVLVCRVKPTGTSKPWEWTPDDQGGPGEEAALRITVALSPLSSPSRGRDSCLVLVAPERRDGTVYQLFFPLDGGRPEEKPLRTLTCPQGCSITAARFSPDSKQVVAG